MNLNINEFVLQNKNILGENCENLGKYIPTGIFWNKFYLSYDKQNRWNVKSLNLVQIVLRKYFNCYKDTHLEPIIRKLTHQQIKYDIFCPSINERFRAIWACAHPQKNYPPIAYFFGNSSIAEAQVICLCDYHQDPAHQRIMGSLIDRLYNENDIVLVEGNEINDEVNSRKHFQTRFINSSVNVEGWEPYGYHENQKNIFPAGIILSSKLDKVKVKILEWTISNNLDIIESACNDLLALLEELETKKEILKNQKNSLVLQINNFLHDLSKKTIDKEKKNSNLQTNTFFNETLTSLVFGQFSNFTHNAILKNNALNFIDKIALLITQIVADTPLDRKQWHLLLEEVTQRNISLISQINKWTSLGKRVFVCAGAAHLLSFPKFENFNIQKELSNYKFVIAVPNQNKYPIDDLKKKFATKEGFF